MKRIKPNSFRPEKFFPIIYHIFLHKAFVAFLGVLRSQQVKRMRKKILET